MCRDVRVENLRKLPGGASRQTWSLDAVYTQARRRGAPAAGAAARSRRSTLNTQRQEEFRLQQAAHAEGVPVPRPYWLAADADELGAPSYLMERVEGETLARRLLRDDEYARRARGA